MKTLIAVPCMDMVNAPFAQSLATLNKEGEVAVSFLVGSLIYESRNKLAKQAISMGADYVLWLDSDMIFDADVLLKMLEHMKSYDIVSGVYYRRQPPFTPVLFKSVDETEDNTIWEHYNDYPEEGMFEIAGCGFGCVMVKTDVLVDMAFQCGNWFLPIKSCGEDLAFCLRAKSLGYKIMCDPSIQCGHVSHLIVNKEVYKTMGGE